MSERQDLQSLTLRRPKPLEVNNSAQGVEQILDIRLQTLRHQLSPYTPKSLIDLYGRIDDQIHASAGKQANTREKLIAIGIENIERLNKMIVEEYQNGLSEFIYLTVPTIPDSSGKNLLISKSMKKAHVTRYFNHGVLSPNSEITKTVIGEIINSQNPIFKSLMGLESSSTITLDNIRNYSIHTLSQRLTYRLRPEGLHEDVVSALINMYVDFSLRHHTEQPIRYSLNDIAEDQNILYDALKKVNQTNQQSSLNEYQLIDIDDGEVEDDGYFYSPEADVTMFDTFHGLYETLRESVNALDTLFEIEQSTLYALEGFHTGLLNSKGFHRMISHEMISIINSELEPIDTPDFFSNERNTENPVTRFTIDSDESQQYYQRRKEKLLLEKQKSLMKRCGIVSIDTAGLKLVNDLWGFEMGNALLSFTKDILIWLQKSPIRINGVNVTFKYGAAVGGDEYKLFYTSEEEIDPQDVSNAITIVSQKLYLYALRQYQFSRNTGSQPRDQLPEFVSEYNGEPNKFFQIPFTLGANAIKNFVGGEDSPLWKSAVMKAKTVGITDLEKEFNDLAVNQNDQTNQDEYVLENISREVTGTTDEHFEQMINEDGFNFLNAAGSCSLFDSMNTPIGDLTAAQTTMEADKINEILNNLILYINSLADCRSNIAKGSFKQILGTKSKVARLLNKFRQPEIEVTVDGDTLLLALWKDIIQSTNDYKQGRGVSDVRETINSFETKLKETVEKIKKESFEKVASIGDIETEDSKYQFDADKLHELILYNMNRAKKVEKVRTALEKLINLARHKPIVSQPN